MAGSSLRKNKRRAMSDINVVPYIDVMLVLLVIFMVTAPMVNPGVVNLPTVGGAKVQSLPPVFLTIDANENVIVRKDLINLSLVLLPDLRQKNLPINRL